MRLLASLVLACALATSWSCASGADEAVARTVDQEEALDLIGRADGPLFLDVRTAAEYASGHVPGALNIPHSELAERLHELDAQRGREVILYCERGGRAGVATEVLARAGFEQLAHLEGDMSAWREKLLPTQR